MNKWAMMYGGNEQGARYDRYGGMETGSEMRRYRGENGRYTSRPGRRAEMDDRYDRRNAYDRYDRYDRDDGGMSMRSDRLIGFKMEREIGPDGRYEPEKNEGMVIPMHKGGEDSKQLTREQARKWIMEMPDMVFAEDEAMRLAADVGMDDEEIFPSFWAVINALYHDYNQLAKEFQVHRPEFYAELAKAWICDEDAVENKAAMYYRYVVEHN